MIPNTDWGIAVVSDGAGTAAHSEIGSQYVVESVVKEVEIGMRSWGWIHNTYLPTEQEWRIIIFRILRKVRDQLEWVAQDKNLSIRDLACTCIVTVFCPKGILMAHIGDGRAAYQTHDGNWFALMKPWKDTDGTSTKFITSDIWNNEEEYIEYSVINTPIKAFTLMSDGCEEHFFRIGSYNKELNRYTDLNQPSEIHLDTILKNLSAMFNDNEDLKIVNSRWEVFLKKGSPKISQEPDDKTMIIGLLL